MTRPTRAPESSRSAPLHFTASSQLHTAHLTRPHLIPEPGQMALLLAQSSPREGGREGERGMALGHPEPPTTFPEASTPHTPTKSLVRGHQPLPPGYQKENVLSNSALRRGIPTTGRDSCLEVPSTEEKACP